MRGRKGWRREVWTEGRGLRGGRPRNGGEGRVEGEGRTGGVPLKSLNSWTRVCEARGGRGRGRAG